jgi:hypothetical protein
MAKEQEVATATRLAAEGRNASDESALEVPEIEANEGPAEEPEKEPDESAAVEGDSGEAGCPIVMGLLGLDPKCRRKIHTAPEGVDEKPVCLMHSKDPNKQSGSLFEEFRREFERILNEAGEGEAHFEGFIFPQLSLFGRKFRAICWFNHATFTQNADFPCATFTQNADFSGATFSQDANFSFATFTQNADFLRATFTQDAFFNNATFTRDANFCFTTFTQNAAFSFATFTQNADFLRATFMQEANFSDVTFSQDANFRIATFTQDADFSFAAFTQAAYFSDSKFCGIADWRESKFHNQVEFRHTRFEPRADGRPSAMFVLARFSKPGEIVFDDIDLSRALFHNCDVSQVWFTSTVDWRKRDGNRGLMVFDETILLDHQFAEQLRKYGPLNYRAVAQIYQQLKKNYDSRLDYWTANEFHFGEMEMKRLAGPTDGRLLRLRRWWHRNLSFVAWYKYASDYGNSYRKPLEWLLGTLLAAALLFPIPGVGLKQPISGDGASTASVTYIRVWNRQDSWTNNFWTEAKLIVKSGITAIDTATFQRTPEYTPVYPRGRVVAIVETLLTSSLFALFLLAIRRQFRR